MQQLKVTLNGTDVNPFHRWGMKHNPFPQIAKAELNGVMMQLNSLGGEPLKGPEDIRARLDGWSEEFIQGCIDRFKPGKRVSFICMFPGEEE